MASSISEDFAGIARRNACWAVLLGATAAAGAVALRLMVRADVGGDQAIFSYPAIVVATLLFGMRAGAVAATICLLALWYFVLPVRHSFVIANAASAITMIVYILVASALIWAIGTMRNALARYKQLNGRLERLVEERTAERNRVWERSRELLVVVERDGTIRDGNPSFRQLSGLAVDRLRAARFEELVIEEDRPAVLGARAELEAGGDGAAATFEARLSGADEVVWVSWSIVRDRDRCHVVGRDFTAERECSELLRQSQKMEVIGLLAGGLAHDFGNLLPPISLTLHLLGKRHADDSRSVELIEAADESVERAGQLITRLLTLSRPSRLEPQVRRVGPLLDEIAPLLQQVIGKRTLKLEVAADVPGVLVDANQLDMALLNLAVNARDATPDDGVLTLGARAGGDGHVDISLSDNGSGMDAATLAHAAEPFFSTKASGEGTGLGLPMVRNFALAAGGELSLESEPGAGTRATISLPAQSDPEPALAAQTDPTRQPSEGLEV